MNSDRQLRATQADLDRLRDEADVLHQRLSRVVMALALVEDLRATACRELAGADPARSSAEAACAERVAMQLRDFRQTLQWHSSHAHGGTALPEATTRSYTFMPGQRASGRVAV